MSEPRESKPGHTPGPWKATKDGRIYSETATEWNRTANAETSTWIATTGANPANARLIAAAPRILALLKVVVEHFWELAEEGDAEDWMLVLGDDARALIAEVEG